MSLRLTNPTGGEVRGIDKYGDGAFGASREHDGKEYAHKGVDLLAVPGQKILCPCDGVVKRVGLAYLNDQRYHAIHVQPDADLIADVKLLYVEPAAQTLPYVVRVGEVIGLSEDLGQRYPGISNHCHLEVSIAGEIVDPTPLIVPS